MLQPTQGGSADRHRIPFHCRLDCRIPAQFPVVVEILVAQARPIGPLAQQAQLGMHHLARITGIVQGPVNSLQQSQAAIRLDPLV